MPKSSKTIAAVILTNRRADDIKTIRTLRNSGWTSDIVIVTDDECPHVDEYRRHSDLADVITFDKSKSTVDLMLNYFVEKVVVHARNMCMPILKSRGYEDVFILDDDYSMFLYKIDSGAQYVNVRINNLQDVVEMMNETRKEMGAKCITLSQGGDFIGGVAGMSEGMEVKRKIMNSFIMSTSDPVTYRGCLNEDSTASIDEAQDGNLVFTYMPASLNQRGTQQGDDGLTDVYLAQGTYVKSMYTVMAHPSCVRVVSMGTTFPRPHHMVTSVNAYPYIVSRKWVKD